MRQISSVIFNYYLTDAVNGIPPTTHPTALSAATQPETAAPSAASTVASEPTATVQTESASSEPTATVKTESTDNAEKSEPLYANVIKKKSTQKEPVESVTPPEPVIPEKHFTIEETATESSAAYSDANEEPSVEHVERAEKTEASPESLTATGLVEEATNQKLGSIEETDEAASGISFSVSGMLFMEIQELSILV